MFKNGLETVFRFCERKKKTTYYTLYHVLLPWLLLDDTIIPFFIFNDLCDNIEKAGLDVDFNHEELNRFNV